MEAAFLMGFKTEHVLEQKGKRNVSGIKTVK